ncbi:MAG: SpoIIE family protein phosphatase [Bacteroidales bacterium]|nr:SpoIIE family protein phosphatase [Bacteroidales bacterium]
MKNYIFTISFIILFFVDNSVANTNNETGSPFIRNYSTEDFQLQNWAIVQDHRGLMYFGNGSGVLEFDGKYWRVIQVANNSTVRSLAIDSLGIIYVGASGEFGCLAADSSGSLKYVSLSARMDEIDRNFNKIYKIHSTSKGIYFISEKRIFRYYNDTISFIEVNLTNQQRYGFLVNDKIYLVQKDKGLFVIHDNKLCQLPHSNFFLTDYKRYIILPYPDNQLLIGTQNNGFYIYNVDMISHNSEFFSDNINNNISSSIVSKFHTEIDEYIKINNLYSCIKTDNNKFIFGTLSGGIIIIDKNGKLVQVINKNRGLKDKSVLALYIDNNKNLWAGLQDGISQIEISSPITIFDESSGLEGVALSTIIHNDIRYAGTHLGIFYLEDYKLKNENDNKTFALIDNGQTPCQGFISLGNELFASSSSGIIKIENTKTKSLFEHNTPYCFQVSEKFPNTVFMGSAIGLSYIIGKKSLNKIIFNNIIDIPELKYPIIEMISDSIGDIWLTTQFNGIIHLQFFEDNITNYSITRYDTANGLPDQNLNYVHYINNKLIVATIKGIYKAVKIPGITKSGTQYKFIVDTSFGNIFSSGNYSATKISNVIDLKTYIYSEDLGIGFLYKDENDKIIWNQTPFRKISVETIYNFFIEKNRILWICTINGLYRYDLEIKKYYDSGYNALIRKVIVGKDSVIFNGTYFIDTLRKNNHYHFTSTKQALSLIPVLNYSNNSIRFEFATAYFEDGESNQYQYILDGFDKEWSNWSSKTEKDYTNLSEGTYIFKIKAKNIFEKNSNIAEFQFIIKPPWYRTYIAYSGYFILLILLFYIAMRLNSRRLIAQNIRLEKIIKERTSEIKKQRDEISEQKQSITDSIYYARRIQNAILPPKKNISEFLSDHFILYKPRDIVSGDFYWISQKENFIYIAAADCTGHGVPGAFMSMMGVAFLNEIVSKYDKIKANEILNYLRENVKNSLHQTGKKNEAKDGMDIALCAIDKTKYCLQYSGANNPLFIIRNNELIIYKPDKMPIGIHIRDYKPFTNNIINLKKGDLIYIFSDGYIDQFGGKSGKKFMSKNFKELLLNINQKPIKEQLEILDNTIEDWKKDTEQIDDILVIGIRIN